MITRSPTAQATGGAVLVGSANVALSIREGEQRLTGYAQPVEKSLDQ